MVHHSFCPLCSSEKIILQFRCTDYFISNKDFDIFKCQTCGFAFTQDYPEENEIWQYYESDEYISHSDTSKGLSNKLYHLVRKVMLNKKKCIVKNITRLDKGHLLDIGSGTGHFAGTMKKSGWQVKGIEINEKARNFAVSQFGLEIIAPEDILSLPAKSFDCITLWHVFEHFHDPFKYLNHIHSLLKTGGTCILALPNCSSADANYYGRFWAAYDVPRHLWHFNSETFRIFSEKAGFVADSPGNLPLDVFYISILSEKYKGNIIPFIAGILKALPFALSSFFNIKKSSSLIYILRKPSGQ